MGKFSDSPYFMLKDYFTGRGDIYNISIRRPIIEFNWPVIWEDRDFVIFDDRPGVVWNLHYYYDPNIPNTDGSYLVGMECNIVTEGDGLIELWVKETDELDVPTGSAYYGRGKEYLPIILRWNRLEDNNFIFTDSDLHNLQPGPSASTIEGLRYKFWNFLTTDLDYQDIINNNRETYFRKDSIYHEWLTTIAPQFYPITRGHETKVRNYANSDTIFHYFGKIFKFLQTDKNRVEFPTKPVTEFRIIFDGLMEYVMRAIPEHQRTQKWDKFCEIFFDRKWHEIYNMLKNVWTLIDPMEIDEEYLGYLSIYYHMYDLITPTIFRQREFVRDLIWLLKRKGTYVEYYIIWRVIANTVNALNIYEKWHDRDIIDGVHHDFPEYNGDTHVAKPEWQEYIYVEKPEYRYSAPIGGAGVGWYNRTYGLSGESIVVPIAPSGYYNYPVKINENPEQDEWGMSNADVDLPVYMTPPENRVLSTHYKLEIDVSTEPLLPDAIVNKEMWDELWQYWEYLRPVNRVVDYNILIAPITDFSGCFISLYDFSPNAYDLTRTLVNLRTPTGWISPHIIADPYWPDCAPSGDYGISPSGGCQWIIEHPLNSKYLHTMAVDTEFNQIVPTDIEIVDKNTVIFHFDTPVYGYGLLKRADTYNIGGNPSVGQWNIYHYLGSHEIILESHARTTPAESDYKMYAGDVNNTGLSGADYAEIFTGDQLPTVVPASSGEYIYIQPLGEESHTWVVPHHLLYRGVITAVYDWNHNQIHQYEFKLTHIDEAVIQFDSDQNPDGVSGYAVFIPVANFNMEDLIAEFNRILRLPETYWLAGENIGDLANETFAASGSIEPVDIYEDDQFIYVNIKLGPEVEGSFREWGIYDPHNTMMIYSKNSEIYKPAGTTLVLHFRIEKTPGELCGGGGIGGYNDPTVCP